MKKISFLFIITFLIQTPFFLFELEKILPGDYPYSIKLGYKEAVSFMNSSHITIFKTDKLKRIIYGEAPYENYTLDDPCISSEEKGGIYYDGYYYLSCLDYEGSNSFQIKVYQKKNDTNFERVVPDTTKTFNYNSGSSIRFFMIHSSEVLIGVAFLDGKFFRIKQMIKTTIKTESEFEVENIARDIDCIYVSEYRRIVCSFGFLSNGIYECGLNVFTSSITQNEFKNNFKQFDCKNHYSRKLRLNSNINEDTNFFYYYFVGSNNIAYISKVVVKSASIIEPGNVIEILRGCSQEQHSFDLAEDKFLGYNVFTCVDSQFRTKIKIQLFKLENGKAVFYGNKNITEYESYNLGQEASMINFIVLGENLDIGYLSFRNNDKKKANFTLFIQPKCEDIINDTYTIGLGGSRDIYFYEMRTKNYGDDISIDIEEYFPEMQITRDRDNKLKYTFKSINDIPGDFKFPFKVYNNYFESETCTISVKVEECYKYCSSCNGTGDDSYHNCTRCKEGLSKLHFPKYDNDAIFNCCEKGVDCPNYVYEVTDGEFKICDEKCTTCENTKDNCSTCYNEKELNIFTRDIREKIKEFKNEMYYLDIDNKTCTNKLENPEKKYLDENEYRYYPCYKSCYNCNKSGDSSNHNCYSCDEINGYFHINNPNSTNCTHEKEVPINYFKNTSESVTFFQSCDENCLGCYDSNSPDQCKQCATNAYPKCVDKDANNNGPFQCFKDNPTNNYFYNSEKKCYSKCDDSCKTCDKEPETNGVKNCLSCDDLLILFNKNCVEDCPLPYKKLEKKCVLECPPYTKEEPYNNNDDEFLECFNCKNDNGKCKYLGTRYTDALGSCIDCNILEHVFPANEYYGIIDDCYELCSSCSQRGTPSKMNCDKCDTESNNPCLVEELGNCIPKGTEIDYFYSTIIKDPDTEDEICYYKKCYNSCKTCAGPGNVLTHNCTICRDGYQFDPENTGNCVIICPFYWYIDSTTNVFTCTKEEKCPEDRPYFTEINKGCVEECSAVVHNAQRNFYRYKKTCITKCPDNSMRDDLLYVCHTLEEEKDIFVYMANYISQSDFVNNLLLYSLDGSKLFHLFNTTELGLKTYKNNSFSVGTSIIDLTNCINTLKNVEGFGNNEVLYIGVLDIIRNDTSAPQFEYTIFNHNGKKLDINYCRSNELVIEKSLNFSTNLSLAKNILENYGYDIIDYKKDNKFFCDICAVFDYDKLDAYDVLLNDRYDYYYDNQEYYFCEDTCKTQATEVDLKKMRVKCVCSGKSNFTSYKKQTFQKYQKFTQNCKDEFLQYFKCANLVFTKDLFTKNVGNYFIFFFIIFQIGNIFLYYFYSKKPMMSHINDVLVKRAKKGYEEDDISSSKSESQSESQSGSEGQSGSGSRQSGSYSRSGSRSDSGSYTGSGSGSKRSGSGSRSYTGSQNQSGSKSGSQRGSQSGSQSGEQQEENEEEESHESGNQSGSQSGSQSGTGSKKSKNSKSSKTGSKSKKNANPPKLAKKEEKKDEKKEKTQYAFISIDNDKKEEEKNKIENIETNDVLNINNKITEEKEEDKSTNGDKNAPNPAWKKYAKRYLNNENKYVDNEYREDSYNFDIPKEKKKKNSDDSDSDEESNEGSKNSNDIKINDVISNKEDENEISEKNSSEKNTDDIGSYTKPKNKKSLKGKTEELPAANIPFKTDLEKFQDEIKKFQKFSFIELYWFILRKKHRIISLLIKKDIYDIFSIKLSLLILSYTIDFFITTLFFFNPEIRKLFHQKNHLEPIYIIFMGIFCILVSTFLIKVVDFLMEYRTNFRRYEILQKYENDRSNYFSSLNAMIKSFKQKMIIYYIIMFVFSTFVWYMCSAFIATYYNTKLIWGCMIGINFGLSNVFPFIYYFFGVLFQYKGIHKENYKMYKLGLVMIKI